MKKIIFILCICSIVACNKKSDPKPAIAMSNYYMTANINDTAWTATTLSTDTSSGYNSITGETYKSNPWKGIGIDIPYNATIGTHAMTFNGVYNAGYVFNGGVGYHDSYLISGSVTITSISTTEAAGTFYFTCKNGAPVPDTVRVTNGKFYMHL